MSTKTCLLILFLVITHKQTSLAQSTLDYISQTIKKDAKHVFSLGIDVITAPFYFDGSDYTKIGVTAALTSGLFITDKEIQRFAHRNASRQHDKIFEIDNYFNGTSAFYSSIGLYFLGFIINDEKPKRILAKNSLHEVDLLEALAVSEAFDNIPEIIAVGIEPQDIETLSLHLSPTVESKMGDLMDMVIRELHKLGIRPREKTEEEQQSYVPCNPC